MDLGDLLAILSAWGHIARPEDLDGSGVVDLGDLLAILAAWGPCPGTAGACCFDDGSCTFGLEDDCLAGGGTYPGDDVTCEDAMCAQPGACGWIVTAPIDSEDDLCGVADSCPAYEGPDIRWAVTIPEDGSWRFATCHPPTRTVLTVDTSTCCGDEYRYEGYCGNVTIDGLVAGQVVFVTLEAAGSCGC